MANKYLKKRKWVILGAFLLVLTLTITGTYALWNYFKVGENQQLVTGDIYMKYKEGSSSIKITNAMPTNTYDPSQVFEFTIEGKNTYTKPIWYEIVIKWGEKPTDRNTRIPDEFIRFRLTEQLPDGEEQEVIAAGKYEDFENGKKIWVNKIAANSPETTITYKLYMWVSNEMHLGSGDDADSSDMDMNTWNTDAFASVKVSVNGDFEEKTLEEEPETPTTGVATEVLKAKLGTDGLVGIPAACSEESCESITDKSADKSTIREYRYSGATANNYVYFNCQDGKEQNADNCEKWRIIGIFKDEDGQEHMKIVRDEVLPATAMPDTYTVSGTSYKIRYSSSSATAYWNYTGSAYNNNWVKGGLKYWLNSEGTTDGYLKSLTSTAQNMIEETKWYLGNFKFGSSGDDTVTAYEHERGSKTCSSSCSGGDIWSGNEATWTGKIGLMYPSDYGFSADSSYWSGTLLYNYNSAASATSWLQKEANHSSYEWLLSPSSSASYYVAIWNGDWNVFINRANSYSGVRPVLYLKSEVQITGTGTGTSSSPYELSCTSCTATSSPLATDSFEQTQ